MSKKKYSRIILFLSVLTLFLTSALPETASALTAQNAVPWYWGNDTNASAIAIGDVNNDGQNETVTAGYYFDGTRWVAQLHVWSGSSLAPLNVQTWYWGDDTMASAVAIGDVNNDGQNEIVTGGMYFDGTRLVAQLHVWSGSSLAPLNVQTWYWGDDTQVNSVAIGDVNGDGSNEIVTGGMYFDGTRLVAQLHVWSGSSLAPLNVQTWYWGDDTYINSIALGNITGSIGLDIVTGGKYFDGIRDIALLHVWNGATLAEEKVVTWYWTDDTDITCVAVANMTGGNSLSIITGGTFFDGTRSHAQLIMWSTSTPSLTVQGDINWYWISDTKLSSIAVGNFSGGSSLDIVTGGAFNDGTRNNAQLVLFNGASLAVQSDAVWFVTSDTVVNSVAIGDFGAGNRIIAGGTYYDGTRINAQLTVWQ